MQTSCGTFLKNWKTISLRATAPEKTSQTHLFTCYLERQRKQPHFWRNIPKPCRDSIAWHNSLKASKPLWEWNFWQPFIGSQRASVPPQVQKQPYAPFSRGALAKRN